MKFRTSVGLSPFVFWNVPIQAKSKNVGEYTLLTSTHVASDTPLYVEHYSPALSVPTFFQIGLLALGNYASKGGQPIGHMFYTDHNFQTFGSSILAYSKVRQGDVDAGDLKVRSTLVLKDATFFVYHAPNLATLISNPKTSARLHDAITSL